MFIALKRISVSILLALVGTIGGMEAPRASEPATFLRAAALVTTKYHPNLHQAYSEVRDKFPIGQEQISPDRYHLTLLTFHIYPARELSAAQKSFVEKIIAEKLEFHARAELKKMIELISRRNKESSEQFSLELPFSDIDVTKNEKHIIAHFKKVQLLTPLVKNIETAFRSDPEVRSLSKKGLIEKIQLFSSVAQINPHITLARTTSPLLPERNYKVTPTQPIGPIVLNKPELLGVFSYWHEKASEKNQLPL